MKEPYDWRKRIAFWLRKKRNELGLTQGGLAAKCKQIANGTPGCEATGLTSISRYETGRHKDLPSPERVMCWAKALQVTPDYFWNDVDVDEQRKADAEMRKRERAALADPELYGFLENYYKEENIKLLKPWGMTYPLVGWRVPEAKQAVWRSLLEFDGPFRLPQYSREEFAFYDANIVEKRKTEKRDMVNNPTFCLRHFDADRPCVVGGLVGKYFDALATCDALEKELLHAWATKRRGKGFDQVSVALHYRNKLRDYCKARQVSPITSGVGRSAAIAIATLTVYRVKDGPVNKFQAFFAPRSGIVANHPHMLHVAPSGMFQPTCDWNLPWEADECREEWNVAHHVYRELVEEIFDYTDEELHGMTGKKLYGLPEVRHIKGFLEPDGTSEKGAELLTTGIIVNLLNLRLEICTLLLIHDPRWYARHASADGVRAFKLNREFATKEELDTLEAGGLPRLLRLTVWNRGRFLSEGEIIEQIGDVSPAMIVAPGAAALWYGLEAAERRLAGLGHA